MDTLANDFFSVALCSQGEYGIDEGLIYSYPCQVKNGHLKIVTDLQHNKFGKEKMQLTLAELRAERDAVKQPGLIK